MKHRDAGFTVLELAIVLIVSVAILAVAVPTLGRAIDSYRLSGRASEIASELNYARARAVMINTTLTFTFADGTYGLDPAPANRPRRSIPKDVTFSPEASSIPTLLFRSNGTISPQTSFVMTNKRGQQVTISVQASGRVMVSDVENF